MTGIEKPLDRPKLLKAFELLGEDLAERGVFVEIAVYGGSAIMLQFEWRRSTEDVDAVVREGYDEAPLAEAVDRVALQMNLDPGWLNNAVGMFTPLQESEDMFRVSGSYPSTSAAGLRILVAKPAYLLAMKLSALRSFDRGDRDIVDAGALAHQIGITDDEALCALYTSIYGEVPQPELRLRFRAVLGRS